MDRVCAAGCGSPVTRKNQKYCSPRCRQRGKRNREKEKRDAKKKEPRSKLYIVPLNLSVANKFVQEDHRHNKPVPGAKFSVGVVDEAGVLRGAAIVGRPVARKLQDGWTLEVNRVVTDGCPNACSFLYGAARRVAAALGYRRLITYTLQVESGASLRGAGWKRVAESIPSNGKGWKSRDGREDQQVYASKKYRWETILPKHNSTVKSVQYPWEVKQA